MRGLLLGAGASARQLTLEWQSNKPLEKVIVTHRKTEPRVKKTDSKSVETYEKGGSGSARHVWAVGLTSRDGVHDTHLSKTLCDVDKHLCGGSAWSNGRGLQADSLRFRLRTPRVSTGGCGHNKGGASQLTKRPSDEDTSRSTVAKSLAGSDEESSADRSPVAQARSVPPCNRAGRQQLTLRQSYLNDGASSVAAAWGSELQRPKKGRRGPKEGSAFATTTPATSVIAYNSPRTYIHAWRRRPGPIPPL